MKRLLSAAALVAAMALPALAQDDDVTRLQSDADVAVTADRLIAAVEGAGGTVFARIDHGVGAFEAGQDIGDSQLVIFGNPAVGTPVMVENRLAGLYLPLKVLVYEDTEGAVWVVHENITERLDDLDGLGEENGVTQPLADALGVISKAAAGGAG